MRKFSQDKSTLKFLLLEGVHQSAINNLHQAGYTNIEYYKGALSSDELKKAISDASFIGIRSRTRLTEEIFACAKKLKAVGCFCIGTNQVELPAATKRGIPVFNAPFSNTRSVAEMVLGEILLLLRKIPLVNAKAHRGEWLKLAEGCFEARGKILGIVGYGHIGTQLSILAEAIGMKVYFYDIENKLPLGNAQQISHLSELLRISDVVSLHVPETQATQNMITSQEINQMKAGAILINASRGSVVDLNALSQSLENKHLSGAAIDVFPTEPATNNDPFESPLCKYDNVILTPHIGGSTLEAQENIGMEVTGKLIKYSDNGSTLSAVNFPEVSLPAPLENVSRLLHIHHNRPGILNQINQIFAQEGINIAAQYLQTTAEIGYVVIDVETDRAEEALNHMRSIKDTIRARLLF